MSHRIPALALFVVVALLGAAALGAFDDGGPSIRAEPVTTSSEPTTSTSTEPTTSTTAAPVAPVVDGQVIRYGGLELMAPSDWPVHDLTAAPTTCVRADQHAVFLGGQGDSPDCPARVIGHTETLWIAPLSDRRQIDAGRATKVTSINGVAARIDPEPELNGALTVIFTDQHLLVIITFGDARSAADAILSSVRPAGG